MGRSQSIDRRALVVASVLLCVFCGTLNGNMDALSDYRQDTIWAQWDNGFTRWMLRGPAARSSIPEWGDEHPIRGLFEAVWDGWHASKSLMIVLLIGALPFLVCYWWQPLLLIPAFQIGFYLAYHHLLRLG